MHPLLLNAQSRLPSNRKHNSKEMHMSLLCGCINKQPSLPAVKKTLHFKTPFQRNATTSAFRQKTQSPRNAYCFTLRNVLIHNHACLPAKSVHLKKCIFFYCVECENTQLRLPSVRKGLLKKCILFTQYASTSAFR